MPFRPGPSAVALEKYCYGRRLMGIYFSKDKQTHHMVLQSQDAALVHGVRVQVTRIADAGASENAVRKGAKDGLSGVHGGSTS